MYYEQNRNSSYQEKIHFKSARVYSLIFFYILCFIEFRPSTNFRRTFSHPPSYFREPGKSRANDAIQQRAL